MTAGSINLRIVLLSGPTCSGKSTLARLLRNKHNATIIKTRNLILKNALKTKPERKSLQLAGERLDREDGGAWVARGLQSEIDFCFKGDTPTGLYVVDSVRNLEQINPIHRTCRTYGAEVHHIHLTATDEELRRRYGTRSGEDDEAFAYYELKRNRTGRSIEKLGEAADIVVSTDRCSQEAVLVRATALLNLYPRSNNPLVDVLIGGQFGSEGKGNIVGHIAPEYDLLVRVGGPNAGHQVYAEPKPEKYYHLPSGTRRAPNAKLLLGPGAVIYPKKLLEEIAEHNIDAERLTIDPRAMIITDEDREEEASRFGSISSTAQGVGIASARKMTGRAAYKEGKGAFLARDCHPLQPYLRSARQILADAMVAGQRILLEGTQGTGLSLHHGDYPFVTTRDTTASGCLADAGIAPSNVRKIIMVCRTYPIRVGGPSGPMAHELSLAEIHRRSGIPLEELEQGERTTTTDRPRRIAEFDWLQFRDSVQLNGPTDIALTFVDYFDVKNRQAFRFEQLSQETIRFVEELERISGRPVSLLSTSFKWRNVIDRRAW